MLKKSLEKYQAIIYIASIVIGLGFGSKFATLSSSLEAFLLPTLALLLYATFTQVSLSTLNHAFQDIRFISIALVGNFIFIPLIVWGLLHLLPNNPAMRLGVVLVLLVPCTDWFITFTQLGGGDTKRAIAFSPISLLFQMVLLPVYTFILLGNELTITNAKFDLFVAFFGIILFPLLMAFITEKWAESSPRKQRIIDNLGWFPVPLLAIVVFMIAASQASTIFEATSLLWYPTMVFTAFPIITLFLAKGLSFMAKLPVRQSRVLAFSLGSRNSFVVLPLALALPPSFQLAGLVIVLQSLIELFAMSIYIWFIPNVWFRRLSADD